MSGWAGMIRFDGAPLDRALFDAMAESLRFRGPDRTGTWIGEQAAFAHTLLATTPEAMHEMQPVVKQNVVFAGDLRIDARPVTTVTDPELALDAYLAHGDAFVERLIGDFSFAIWDERQRRLLLVRDRFARRPLFVARHDGALFVTNNLPTLLAVPHLADALDERAIADFLLFGRNYDARRTTFANIERVPAAHRMIVSAERAELQRYWTIPQREHPRRIRPADAYAEFRDVFSRAVADRARADRIVISLSGGLDSNAVAATLVQLRERGQLRAELTALTTVWNEVIQDDEGRYAAIAAKAYGIPLEFHAADACEPFEGWSDPRVRGWEPTDEPCTLPFFEFVRRAASHARVVLTGEGGDPLLYASHDHFFRLLKRLQWVKFVRESVGYALTRRRRPPLNVRSQLQLALGHTPGLPPFVSWIAPELERRLQLRDRWYEVLATGGPRRHPYRHDAWRILDSPSWSRQFEASDAGTSGQPLEWLSPYLDVRVVELLFSLPPMPYFANKDLVRQAMRGWIPDEVRTRPKTALSRDPSAIGFARSPKRWVSVIENASELDRFVDRRILCLAIQHGGATDYHFSQQAFAVSLALWMTRSQE
jgi:asparagine synthase (glutamine-hydrolysing)